MTADLERFYASVERQLEHELRERRRRQQARECKPARPVRTSGSLRSKRGPSLSSLFG